ncbi:hypothetical protein Q8A67_001345 [Cirrhinus molitorella]|uniref:Fibronectin type-III domain-containing protein n=1 Tax=Cirrhinus molitorella TaxID=172907 RepID=A0AA88QBB9_9TELE|nr:hypothetical protein Q8A67_001345 [Cirrhinus molitorella]
MNHLPSGNIPGGDNDIATHVVTAILYGADACFVFDREVSSDEDKNTIEGEVQVAYQKLQAVVSVDANADLNMNDNQKTAVKKFTCTFYGDFQLPSNPTSFEDALKVFADLPKLLEENQELAVPLRVWLYPLDKLHSSPSKLQKDISMDLIIAIESVFESLNTTEMKCSDLLKDSPALKFAKFHAKILKMNENCCTYKLRLMKKLGSLLPNIRGDVTKETALNDLLHKHDDSPFRANDLTEWVKDTERESEIIKIVLRQLEEYGAEVVVNLELILMDLKVGNLEMEDNPGSCILLYENGCDEAICFSPPSKPDCPITKEVKGQNVVLKVPPSCPATVELRLLYKLKQDSVWTSKPVLKDQDTVTLTDLREETEYEIKLAAVGKLNYTVDSEVIRVNTEVGSSMKKISADK